MFTVKAIKDNHKIRHAYQASRYSVFDKGEAGFEVVLDEPGSPAGLCLFVNDKNYEHLIIENSSGHNVEHLRAVDHRKKKDDVAA